MSLRMEKAPENDYHDGDYYSLDLDDSEHDPYNNFNEHGALKGCCGRDS